MKEQLTKLMLLACILVVGHFIAYKIIHIPGQLEVVIILSILLFYPILRKPIIGLYAVFIISPFIPFVRRLYYLLYTRPKIDPLIVVSDILLIVILLGLLFEFRENKNRYSGAHAYIRVILIYFIYLVIRSFFFNYLPIADGLTKLKFYGPPVLFFFIGITYANSTNHLKCFWIITIIIGILSSFYGLSQLYNGYSEAELIWFSSIEFSTLFINDIARPFSFFQAPVAFADYIQLTIIGILMWVLWNKNPATYLLLLSIPILFYSVLVTSVRSSWIGIVLTLFIWAIFFRTKGNKLRITIFIIIVLICISYQYIVDTLSSGYNFASLLSILADSFSDQQYFNLFVSNRMSAIYNPLEEHSFLSRLMHWRDLLVYSLDPAHAFLGRGLGAQKADSLYFTYLAEFGYPGMIFIIIILIVFISKGFTLVDTSKNNDNIAIAKGITTMNIIFAIVSITGTHIHYFPGDIYFWFWNGVLIQLTILDKSVLDKSESGDKLP
jgi:hypothetical protein